MEMNNNKSNSRIIVSIIIPVFNTINFTKVCLKSLYDQMSHSGSLDADFKIVVVDDGSKDGTTSWIKEHYPSVYLLKGDGNLWWSGGINKGIDFALKEFHTNYILWWNNDIIPANGYFSKLVKLIKENDEDILIGSKVFVLHQNLIWGMGGKFDPAKGTRFMYGMQQKDCDTYQKPFEVDWFPGMGTIIHRTVFERIGLLDAKNFPQYHGDSDFTFRAKKAGFKLIAYPELVIYNDTSNTGLSHEGSLSNLFKSLTSIKSKFNIHKDIIFFRKHASSYYAYLLLMNKYFRYIGGYCKWKFLNYFGVKKTEYAADK